MSLFPSTKLLLFWCLCPSKSHCLYLSLGVTSSRKPPQLALPSSSHVGFTRTAISEWPWSRVCVCSHLPCREPSSLTTLLPSTTSRPRECLWVDLCCHWPAVNWNRTDSLHYSQIPQDDTYVTHSILLSLCSLEAGVGQVCWISVQKILSLWLYNVTNLRPQFFRHSVYQIYSLESISHFHCIIIRDLI